MISAGIYGGSGYMGGEVIRILLDHPKVKIAWITSRGNRPVEYFHRNLIGRGLAFVKPDQTTRCDVVFAALPAGQIMKMASSLLADGTKIIDLGADFRLKNRDDWERKYGMSHENWNLVEEAVYGITELHRDEIRKAYAIVFQGSKYQERISSGCTMTFMRGIPLPGSSYSASWTASGRGAPRWVYKT